MHAAFSILYVLQYLWKKGLEGMVSFDFNIFSDFRGLWEPTFSLDFLLFKICVALNYYNPDSDIIFFLLYHEVYKIQNQNKAFTQV